MLRRVMYAVACALLMAAPLAAQNEKPQEKKPSENKPAAQTVKAPEPVGQPVNVRIELAIADQTGPGEPAKKIVTMVVADRQGSSIRTNGWVIAGGERRSVSINVDARPTILKDGTVRVDLGLEYTPTGIATPGANPERSQTGLNERVSTILESGKPLIVSQAADPLSDRRITVELKATILK